MAGEPRTWILTGSPENYAATRALDHRLIGVKERNRNRALAMRTGDRIVLYLTRVMAIAASIRIVGELYEDRSFVWPGRTGRVDPYPWRFPTAPEVVVPEHEWIPAESLADELDHIAKWPRAHWTLAFQGQLRIVSEHDARVLMERLHAAAGAVGAGSVAAGSVGAGSGAGARS